MRDGQIDNEEAEGQKLIEEYQNYLQNRRTAEAVENVQNSDQSMQPFIFTHDQGEKFD